MTNTPAQRLLLHDIDDDFGWLAGWPQQSVEEQERMSEAGPCR